MRCASAMHPQPVPAPPSIDALMEQYPHVHRLLLTQALALASLRTPAALVCCLALVGSLLHEGVPFREDARLLAAQVACWLQTPAIGLRLLGEEEPASLFHQDAFRRGRAALEGMTEHPLAEWFPGVASVAASVSGAVSDLDGDLLAIGPTAALSTFHHAAAWRFCLNIPSAAYLAQRFGAELPKVCVLAEGHLSAAALRRIAAAYESLGFTRIVAVTHDHDLGGINGFEHEMAHFAVPVGVPISLGDPRYWQAQSTETSASFPVFSGAQLTLHSWKRCA